MTKLRYLVNNILGLTIDFLLNYVVMLRSQYKLDLSGALPVHITELKLRHVLIEANDEGRRLIDRLVTRSVQNTQQIKFESIQVLL